MGEPLIIIPLRPDGTQEHMVWSYANNTFKIDIVPTYEVETIREALAWLREPNNRTKFIKYNFIAKEKIVYFQNPKAALEFKLRFG